MDESDNQAQQVQKSGFNLKSPFLSLFSPKLALLGVFLGLSVDPTKAGRQVDERHNQSVQVERQQRE